MGFLGVGGSSIATPVLSVLGVAPLAAVASPLPAQLPAAAVAGWSYLRSGEARPRAAGWSLMGGAPGTVLGALVSDRVGGRALLLASGLVLVFLGVRLFRPIGDEARAAGERRRLNRPLLVGATAGVGFLTGLLANGGAFLLVPLYVLVFGLRVRQAVGTSLVVVAGLIVPTLASHWILGHIAWRVSAWFAVGAIPASAVSSRVAQRVESHLLRTGLAAGLVAFGAAFTLLKALGR